MTPKSTTRDERESAHSNRLSHVPSSLTHPPVSEHWSSRMILLSVLFLSFCSVPGVICYVFDSGKVLVVIHIVTQQTPQIEPDVCAETALHPPRTHHTEGRLHAFAIYMQAI